jgi:recombinational DNA repair protein RecR
MSELNHCQFCNCKTVTDTCKTCQGAVDATEERIIKLLEDFMNSDELEPEAADGIWQVLPLIKGAE